MRRLLHALVCALVSVNGLAQTEPAETVLLQPLPTETILVKGAVPHASDRSTPVPEAGRVASNVYKNAYFGLSFPLLAGLKEGLGGPPPSEDASYFLTQLQPSESFTGPAKPLVLVTAQDLFFAQGDAKTAMDVAKFSADHLPSYYDLERAPVEVNLGGRRFVRFDYKSGVASLYWRVLTTEIRCHALQFVFVGGDAEMLETMVASAAKLQLQDLSESPLCIRNYAAGANIISRLDPVLAEEKQNAIPVRIVIDKKGRVKHVHVISAFKTQADTVIAALQQWTFKPYLRDGKPVEIETGLLIGNGSTLAGDT